MTWSGLKFARFTVANVVLNLLEDVGLPKILVDSSEGVVDTRVSMLVVQLDKSLSPFFRIFENLANLLSIFSVERSILEEVT